MSIHVLIVEDCDDDALLILRQFQRAGLDVTHRRVDTAAALAQALREQPPHVVISDYNMPSFSAHDALVEVRATGLDLPFILVSGEIGEETAAALMRAGAHDFVLKDRLARLVPAVQRELREAADRRHRRDAEAALRSSEERFRLLAEHAQDIIFRYRWLPEPAVEYVSPAVLPIIGHPAQDLYADPDLVFSLIEGEDRELFEASWRNPGPRPLTVRWRRRDGGLVWMEQRVAAVRDEAGRVVAVEGILRDTTERVLAEQEREKLEHQLRQTERLDSLGHLAGGVAHDFNNLLAVITGYCAMVADSVAPDHECQPDLDGIRDAAERGAALARQLLIFSRLEPSRPETVTLNELVNQTRDLLNRTLGEDVQLVTILDPALPTVTIDRSKMEQVMMNVIVNARAAMPDGGQLTIRTERLPAGRVPRTWPERPQGDLVRLSVTDVGCGMTPEVARRAFEPFFTTRPRGQGTGLGLATAYGAVADAGGHIELESVPGRGTTVHILLPAAGAPADVDRPVDPTVPDGGGETVLLVEDEDGVREVVRRILTKAGYLVRDTGSPAEALDLFAARGDGFDLLLSDVIMPGMSGTQLAAAIRQRRPALPVLFMSGYTTGPAPGGQALPDDAVLLHKPFDRPALLAAVRGVLQSARQSATT